MLLFVCVAVVLSRFSGRSNVDLLPLVTRGEGTCVHIFNINIIKSAKISKVLQIFQKLKNDLFLMGAGFIYKELLLILLHCYDSIVRLVNRLIKIIISMAINPFLFQKEILQQIVAQVGVVDGKQQDNIKRQLDNKYHKHINLIQYHQLRQDKFVLSQKKILEKQQLSIQKTKEYIKLRQEKANQNKNHTIIERSKRIESDLNRWQKIVEKNKEQHQKKLKESLHLVKQWNQKMSESSSRKTMRLYNVSRTLQQKSNERLNKIQSQRQNVNQQTQLSIKKTPKQREKKTNDSRYTNSIQQRKNSRISTQSVHYRIKQNEEDLLEKSLMKNGQKTERINQARYMKHYLLQKKNKIRQQKQENLKKLRQHRLNEIKQEFDERNQQLDQKLKNDRVKPKNKKSLPSVLGSKAGSFLFLNGPGEQWRSKKILENNPKSPSQKLLVNQEVLDEKMRDFPPNYDKLIVQKLKNVSLLTRKGKNF